MPDPDRIQHEDLGGGFVVLLLLFMTGSAALGWIVSTTLKAEPVEIADLR